MPKPRWIETETGPASEDSRPLVGITAPRDLDARWQPLVGDVVGSIERADSPRRVAVGDCPTGGDRYVVEAATQPPRIFQITGASGVHFAQRSAEMVRTVWASARYSKGAGLIGLPHDPCPEAILASPDSRTAFPGAGNGTWSTLALCAGFCVQQENTAIPILVFWCADGPPQLAAHWPAMRWESAGGRGIWARAWRLIIDYTALPQPDVAQGALWDAEVEQSLGAPARRSTLDDTEVGRRRR